MKFLITAGPTIEYIDPVRFISNPSSGKMGVAIANAAVSLGHDVDLVLGKTIYNLNIDNKIKIHDIITTDDMLVKVESLFSRSDVLIMAAAVCDYKPEKFCADKIKKNEDVLKLKLIKTTDILKTVAAKKKQGQILAGFAAETQDLLKNAKKKMQDKNLDMIIANDISLDDAGFEKDTNSIKILYNTKKGIEEFGVLPKVELGHIIIDRIINVQRLTSNI